MLSCSIVFSQDYLDKQPENPKSGKYYAKCVIPDVFKKETIVVESIPSYDKLEIIPAVYKKVVDAVWTKEPYHKITIDDAEFEFIYKEVEVLASTESWVAGEKDPDCPSINPNDCRIFHYRKDPAITRKIPVSIVKTGTSSQKTKIKGNYKLVKRNVEVSPATSAVKTIPAITEQISRKVVVTDEATKVISVAAENINVTKRILVKKGGMTAWRIVPCTILTRVGVVPIY